MLINIEAVTLANQYSRRVCRFKCEFSIPVNLRVRESAISAELSMMKRQKREEQQVMDGGAERKLY